MPNERPEPAKGFTAYCLAGEQEEILTERIA